MAENIPKTNQGAGHDHGRTQNNTLKDASVGGGNVDQIREILFGSQMKDYERKFSRLEERILREISGLKEDSNKRLDSLQSFINREIELLSHKLKAEKESRDDSFSNHPKQPTG